MVGGRCFSAWDSARWCGWYHGLWKLGESAPDAPWDDRGTAPAAMQIHNAYIVAPCPEGLLIVDQHALHERILYEELRRRVAEGRVEAQRLLVPEPVDLNASEAALVLEQQDSLAQLGLEIEPFEAAKSRMIRPAERCPGPATSRRGRRSSGCSRRIPVHGQASRASPPQAARRPPADRER